MRKGSLLLRPIAWKGPSSEDKLEGIIQSKASIPETRPARDLGKSFFEMTSLIILIGLQASGKTSFARERLAHCHWVNRDVLKTRAREAEAIREGLASGKDIVIDKMNFTRGKRAAYIAFAREHGLKVRGYFFQSRVSDCIERNEGRPPEARVPREAIAATSNRLQLPSPDEGFDELYFVRLTEGGFEVSPWEKS